MADVICNKIYEFLMSLLNVSYISLDFSRNDQY
jgi:hypothetical protein